MSDRIRTIAWGLYCATSWTWCIGMFLPRILMERFGWPGVLAFAIPNVLGCAAFGYVLRCRAKSETLVRTHGTAMRCFSVVTVAYHIFFLLSLPALAGEGVLPIHIESAESKAFGAGAFLLAIGLAYCPRRLLMPLAAVLYVASLLVFVDLGFGALDSVPTRGTLGGHQLAWLSPVLCFGFLLCPYLDLTFHRALQESPSRHAFGVFGIAFAVMLVITCILWRQPTLGWSIALAHLYWQATITMALHLHEWMARWRDVEGSRSMLEGSFAVLALPAGALAALVGVFVLHGAESIYLRFLVFYGLIFPAYVIVFMVPGGVAVSLRNLLFFAAAICVAAPFYEVGFIGERMWWLGVPMAAAALWTGVAITRARRRNAHHISEVGVIGEP